MEPIRLQTVHSEVVCILLVAEMIASLVKKHGEVEGSAFVVHFYKSLKWLSFNGPVAQLGARFHGMEEIVILSVL